MTARRLAVARSRARWKCQTEGMKNLLEQSFRRLEGNSDQGIFKAEERLFLDRFVATLEANQERDPKYAVVLECLKNLIWLSWGCIIFSQYRDSIQWLADQLTQEWPQEPIALYSGPSTSGIMRGGE